MRMNRHKWQNQYKFYSSLILFFISKFKCFETIHFFCFFFSKLTCWLTGRPAKLSIFCTETLIRGAEKFTPAERKQTFAVVKHVSDLTFEFWLKSLVKIGRNSSSCVRLFYLFKIICCASHKSLLKLFFVVSLIFNTFYLFAEFWRVMLMLIRTKDLGNNSAVCKWMYCVWLSKNLQLFADW